MRSAIPLRGWKVGWSKSPENSPEELIDAKVPGAVQLDWARAKNWPDFRFGDNFREYSWMEDVWWRYEAPLDFKPLKPGERIEFVCQGIDYQFRIELNGETLLEQEGMFTPIRVDLTGRARPGDKLVVHVAPAPKCHKGGPDRYEAEQSCKPPVSYGWDWHPRLIPLGIWDEARLERLPAAHFKSADIRCELESDFSSAAVLFDCDVSSDDPSLTVRFAVYAPDGSEVFNLSSALDQIEEGWFGSEIPNPELWWPHDQGTPALYSYEASLMGKNQSELDRMEGRFGVRRARLVMAPGQWERPELFPKSRSEPPITMEINGRSIFCRGSNWVNPEIFPGTITRARYRELLLRAKDANMNLLRVWGGGIVNKEAFYELCDELGIMVWTEFPLACCNYPDKPEYLSVLNRESKSIIRRVRRHPSNVLWCGGNELFNVWSGMTDQSHALRLLNRNCYDLDRKTPFLPTSPVMGMMHGFYGFRDKEGREVYEIMRVAGGTAYTEFGMPGPSSVENLRTFMPEQELFPPREGTAWETHHGIGAWRFNPDAWLGLSLIREYFGDPESPEQLVEWGQLLQSEGYKAIFEEARRQKPRCSMALNWDFSDVWPTAANNSLISYPNEPKPAYFAVADSCRPVLASAQLTKFQWRGEELFKARLWLLNDSPNPTSGRIVHAELVFGESRTRVLSWPVPDASANVNVPGPMLSSKLPEPDSLLFYLELLVEGGDNENSRYTLRHLPAKPVQSILRRGLNE